MSLDPTPISSGFDLLTELLKVIAMIWSDEHSPAEIQSALNAAAQANQDKINADNAAALANPTPATLLQAQKDSAGP